jgi:antibiotic biosynthesis monooxygenase (ABM) superfamily enzyme
MATMIVKHRVANFESWKAVFDEMNPVRAKFGWTGHIVLRDATDPNLVTIVNRMKTLENAKAYGGSPELRAGMQRAGVVGAPEISFCEDADEKKTY